MDYRTFCVDLPSGELDNLVEQVEKPSRNITKYFICFEGTNKQGKDKPHYHVLVYCDRKSFLSLFAHIKDIYGLVEKQKELRKGKKGGVCLYAALKKKETVETYEHFLTYLCKEQKEQCNYRTSGIDESVIQQCLNDAYKDVETVKKLELQQLFKYIDQHSTFIKYNRYDNDTHVDNMKTIIVNLMIEWIFEHKDTIQLSSAPTSIKSYFYKYLRTSEKLHMYYRTQITKQRVLHIL